MSAGLRSGLLYSLSLGVGDNKKPAQPSRINDRRFQLGGPTDVRGFRECGLEPGDRNDSVGGDVYMAGGANIYYFPIPKVGPIYSFLVLIFALVDSLCFFPIHRL